MPMPRTMRVAPSRRPSSAMPESAPHPDPLPTAMRLRWGEGKRIVSSLRLRGHAADRTVQIVDLVHHLVRDVGDLLLQLPTGHRREEKSDGGAGECANDERQNGSCEVEFVFAF